ncbi:MAG: bifunctional homocysteine S-methyltransferase/methylenetetrahydrofolate reductase [Myxococcota bacterium]|nr:bifunctional homocysteine S-methyltransferase/methylenetetrahydrofolate reductase [Myxococcota bacterium]
MASIRWLDALRAGGVVLDGAMGTALFERGLPFSSCLDAASLERPELVRAIHESHARAGADALLTNTFGVNRYRLAPHGRSGDVERLCEAAVRIAREVHGPRWVLGSVGPTGLMLKAVRDEERAEIRAAFREQVAALARAGVDGLVLETFRQPAELLLAIEGAREAAPSLPLVASCSFDAFGTMADGTGPEAMAEHLEQAGVDALGVNCADGPAGVYEMATRMLGVGLPVVAQPNAGLPRRVEGRLAYLASPEYFGLYARRLYKAGIAAVGGCCGTTADHVRRIAAAARMRGAQAGDSDDAGGGMREEGPSIGAAREAGLPPVPTSEKGPLGARLGRKLVVSVEVNPPPGLSLDRALQAARMLRDAGIDAINCADGPRASARMGNLALCYRIEQELGMPALLHVTTRDRNLLALVAHLLCAHELGVRNLVCITGDPPKMGDFPDATAVYDVDSIGLLRIVQGLNRGLDPGGKPLGERTAFLCATGAEPASRELDREMRRLRAKVEAGAELVMTQPVFDPEVLDRFLAEVRPLGVPVLVGLLPLASWRNAEFLHHEVPGMQIPEEVRERMRRAGSGEAARREGVAIAREMALAVRDRVQGFYVMPPLGRYELALSVLEGII